MPGGGVITGPPDFIGMGTQRSGTTWWQRLLKRHPAIKTPLNRKKEQHFFDKFGKRPMQRSDIARYHQLFPRGPGELSGEWTPRYMRDIWGPRVVAQAAPDTKVLIMFRDPVERFRSGVLHQGARTPYRDASWLATDAIERGRYALQLRRVYDYFDEDQVLVLQYEQCIADPAEHYRRTLDFIGAPQHAPKDPKRTRGTAQKSRKEPIWEDLRYAIVRELEEEVAELNDLVPHLDVSLWRNFEHVAHASRAAPQPTRPVSVPASRGGPPDYVGVGTEDAGCRWWHSLLLEHDAIDAPAERSLDFFGTFCTRAMTDEDVAGYRAHFERRQGVITGEWTRTYMYESWTPMLLHRAAPDAKLLVMLRNPVERYALNLARSRRRRRNETDTLSNTVSVGRYAPQLRGLLEYYERDQVLVLQLERCQADPLGEYARTLEFLGVDTDFRPSGLRRRLLRRPASRTAGAPTRPDVELWPDLEIPMLKELEADVSQLRELVPELDVSLWPQFGGGRAPSASGLHSPADA